LSFVCLGTKFFRNQNKGLSLVLCGYGPKRF
jgi:hypothetical protein